MGDKGNLSEFAKRQKEKSAKAKEQERKAKEEPEHRFTADIPKSLHKRLRLRSVQEDRSMKAILIDSLNQYLRE